MKVLDEASISTEAGLKTVTVVFKGAFHGASMLTDTIKEERKVQKLKCKIKTNQTVEDAVKAGIDRDIAIAECAAIEAEI